MKLRVVVLLTSKYSEINTTLQRRVSSILVDEQFRHIAALDEYDNIIVEDIFEELAGTLIYTSLTRLNFVFKGLWLDLQQIGQIMGEAQDKHKFVELFFQSYDLVSSFDVSTYDDVRKLILMMQNL